MCGIVGYIGKNLSRRVVMEGLSRLEYRGYDSAGFACLNPLDNRFLYAKSAGRLPNLIRQLDQHPIDGHLGIGHTRWSTHGIASSENAHPHFDCQKTISVVHNGIIENHHELRNKLKNEGHIFHSQTDTEVVAHLLESLLVTHCTLKAALLDLLKNIDGAYALVLVLQEYPDQIIVVRKRSPLCIGIGENEMVISSDPLAFAGKTKTVFFMPDESFALVKQDAIEAYDFVGKTIALQTQELALDWDNQEKKGHEHYMLKEIYEQKNAIYSTVSFLRSISNRIGDHIGLSREQIKNLDKLTLIGCGTSWHAARIAQFFFEHICLIPTRVSLASEFRYMSFFAERNSAHIFISQSGETADTLESLRLVNTMDLPTIALTNVPSSTLVREADGFLLTQAGQEIAVASTKAFSTQMVALYWLAHRLAFEKGIVSSAQLETAEEDMLVAAEVLENCIENYKREIVQSLGKYYAQFKKAIFLGRHISYPFALEAALKLKEISYIFAQCYPAGELKHGPLALVDNQTPVFIFSHQDPIIYQKLLSNAQEIKAREGHLVVFAWEGQHELIQIANQAFIIPHVKPLLGPLAMTGLMQMFVYQIAKELGCPIDKPRNLAKSVTVE